MMEDEGVGAGGLEVLGEEERGVVCMLLSMWASSLGHSPGCWACQCKLLS